MVKHEEEDVEEAATRPVTQVTQGPVNTRN